MKLSPNLTNYNMKFLHSLHLEIYISKMMSYAIIVDQSLMNTPLNGRPYKQTII